MDTQNAGMDFPGSFSDVMAVRHSVRRA